MSNKRPSKGQSDIADSSSSKPMSDAHIHAFVDRQLKHEREERLQELVSAWPEKYEQVQEYQIINQRLADGLTDIYDQPIPNSLSSLLSSPPPASKSSSSVRDFLKSKTTVSNKPKSRKSKTNKSASKVSVDEKSAAKSIKHPLEMESATKADTNDIEQEKSKDSALEFAQIDQGDSDNEIRTLDVDLPRTYVFNLLMGYFSGFVARSKSVASGKLQLAASIFIGIVIGWVAHNSFNVSANSDISEVAQSAINAHVFYTAESKHAVEVSAMNKKHLRNWIKKNLDSALEPVNLSKYNYELMGGRVLPLKGKLAGQYMYENTKNKSRLTIYMSRYLQDNNDSSPNCEKVESPARAELIACGWKKANLVFYVIAKLSDTEITKVANRIKKLMPKKEKV